MNAVSETNLPGLTYRGKVRDTYDLGDGRMLMIATDRISAFDVVIPTPIAGKGAILTRMSKFWFDLLADVMPNHMIAPAYDADAMKSVDRVGVLNDLPDDLALRSMVIKKAERIDIECVVRAYITGSAWAEYKKSGTVNSARMPDGMIEADQFPGFLFTPSTKAEVGHDEPMTAQEVIDMVGAEMARKLEEVSIKVFTKAHDYARGKGMILADTKFEFGIIDGELTLIDEVLTPDSSRFWDVNDYEPGNSPPAFDKQFVRDWLSDSGWNKEPPAPELPDEIVQKTIDRYSQALERLTGQSIDL
ncbi:MAG: phosphoribosylaminoimidazolesuccinocarboxamide synthase [Chloroflexi bacterium]|nr:phosphoribosylaminoimidazolesuccinocarboxamide synthase [Chloroflexota bacterium]